MGEQKLDYRKLIEFGKSSYVISLPKTWLAQQKLSKGDSVQIDVEEDKLCIYPPTDSKPEKKKITLDITDLDLIQTKMLLISRYIRNYGEITIVAKDLPKRSKQVRNIIHDLLALEIVEETGEMIKTQDFLNMESIDLLDTIKKMELITRDMLKDSTNSFDENMAESLEVRDKDVNRYYYLASRLIRYLQRRPATAKANGFTQGELLRMWNLAVKIESIADNSKRVSKMMRRLQLNGEEKKELKKLYVNISKYYEETVDAYFAKEQRKSIILRPKANKLTKDCKDYFRSNWDVDWVPTILEKLKSIVADIKSITATLCDMS